jgi:hypothetical protein
MNSNQKSDIQYISICLGESTTVGKEYTVEHNPIVPLASHFSNLGVSNSDGSVSWARYKSSIVW